MREPLTLDVSVVVLVQHSKPEGYSTLNKLQDSVPYHQTRYQLLADCPEGVLETKRPADAKNSHQKHWQSGQGVPGNPPDLAERNPTKRSRSSVWQVGYWNRKWEDGYAGISGCYGDVDKSAEMARFAEEVVEREGVESSPEEEAKSTQGAVEEVHWVVSVVLLVF